MTPLPAVRPLFYAINLLCEHNNNIIIIIILGISFRRCRYYYGIGIFFFASRGLFGFLYSRAVVAVVTAPLQCLVVVSINRVNNAPIIYIHYIHVVGIYTGATYYTVYSLTIDDADQIVIRFLTQCLASATPRTSS